jgi:hypothetical protein
VAGAAFADNFHGGDLAERAGFTDERLRFGKIGETLRSMNPSRAMISRFFNTTAAQVGWPEYQSRRCCTSCRF